MPTDPHSPPARSRHCIVTPEVVPLVRNGGVASNALNLATFLTEKAGLEVVILMTRTPYEGGPEAVEFVRRTAGALLRLLDDVSPAPPEPMIHPEALARSLRTLRWLEQEDFAVIHFMQYQGAGFASIRAKRLGRAFLQTQLVTIINSPERWLAQHGKRLPDGCAAGFLLDYMERYGVEWSDHVVCPSRAMLEWLRADGWVLSKDTRWLPTYSPTPAAFLVAPANRQHVVFFGRLETRKGLELFVEALRKAAEFADLATLTLQISFLGKVSRADGRSADTYLREALCELPPSWRWEMITQLDHEHAMRYLAEHSGSLYVMPSLTDNSPNTVTECLYRGLRVLSAEVPGVSELFASRDHLVAPTPEAWAVRLRQAILHGEAPAVASCPPDEAIRLRLNFLQEIAHAPPISPPLAASGPLLITVVVAHYNLGRLLTETLAALKQQTDPYFEVVVVDDGSTCQESLTIFTALERGQTDARFRYVRQENAGVCAARNHGAALGRGALLVFVDADNLPLPHMLATMRQRLEWTKVDALSCDLYTFEDGCAAPFASLNHHWAFVGGCLEAAVLTNCLGDTNLMVRRTAFEEIGGFHSAKEEASADRALLIRLLRQGFKLEATDEYLFAYRRREASMSRTANDYERGRPVMAALSEGLEPWMQRLLEASFPVYGFTSEGESTTTEARRNEKLQLWRERYENEKAKRRERDQRVDHLHGRLTEWRNNALVRLARFLRMIRRDF